MPSIHAAGRRPTFDVRACATTARRDAASRRSNLAAVGAGADADAAAVRDADFAMLVDRAIEAIRAAGDRDDPVFGPFAELNSIVRAVTYHEGRLLEWGVARLAAENPSLLLMPAETTLPIVPAAVEVLKRNDWSGLEGLRLRSEVHYKTSYVPDLFLVDRDRHSALILDLKRSLASYPERRLNALRGRMMAAALIAGDWLHIEGRVAGVSSIGIAIIDGSSERRDRASGVFALDQIGELIGVPDAGEAMLGLRAKFAQRVREEVDAACRRAIADGGDGTAGPLMPPGDEDVDAEDSDPDPDADRGDDEPRQSGISRDAFVRAGSRTMPSSFERRSIAVGFARGGAP